MIHGKWNIEIDKMFYEPKKESYLIIVKAESEDKTLYRKLDINKDVVKKHGIHYLIEEISFKMKAQVDAYDGKIIIPQLEELVAWEDDEIPL